MTLKTCIYHHETWQYGFGAEHKQLIYVGVRSCRTRNRVELIDGILALLLHPPRDHPANQHRSLLLVRRAYASHVMRPPAGRHGLDLPGLIELEPVSDDAAHVAAFHRLTQIGGAVEAKGTREGGAVEPQELVPIGDAPRMLFGELVVGFGLDGVSVVFEPCDGLRGVVDLQDPVYLANWSLILEPA